MAGGGAKKEPTKPYIGPPSTGHEIGIMFGFLAFMVICMLLYGVIWQVGNKRSQKKEADRIQQLRASGLLKDEKATVENTT
ncbi:hypothetical protein K469DRAFT_699615 [Zopfia rhizophila CBS 207.26]|uniref:Uncharacterized protein n=1 Tax=Zopfia rhizophila CBS 207.26 TaxID=1314779 RepID=A0A6A6EIT4_9PEZI|nr:hypothetical protein K469DRAFT_699615 [Zopfia rhizophila CBS 207.26]